VEIVELDTLTDAQWDAVLDGEHEPFGGIGEQFSWREKERQLAIRGADGRLLALAASTVAEVDVDGAAAFRVLGIGGVIVTRRERGRGLAFEQLRALLADAERDPSCPQRAMLFCRKELSSMYGKLGFHEISAPVWVAQPHGRIEIPLAAMWRPLVSGAGWPEGRVDVRGLPF
jgi:predicted GNAT family N-acyltransferase